ncbi:hypothetical protein SDC9_93834 [bioreactor metagenome]|uniref:Uncharacterized protein n=1 Tax=bioreactor metagenome TaxID=1076179 RepID=A0A645A2I4_9ZZZZ
MILNHVAQSPGTVVIASAASYADFFGRSDLDPVNVFSVPYGLEKAIIKPCYHDILYRFFSEVVVDTINLFLKETVVKFLIQFNRSIVAISKRFLYDDTFPSIVL